MPSVYRDEKEGARCRVRELLALRLEDLARLPDALRRVYIKRVARATAGYSAILGTVVCALLAFFSRSLRPNELTYQLLFACALGMLGYLFGWLGASLHLERLLLRVFTQSPDISADLDRLARLSPGQLVREVAEAQEKKSAVLPLIALSLLAPLCLHLLFALLFGWKPGAHDNGFDRWIVGVWVLTGHCHILLAYWCWRFVERLRKGVSSPKTAWQEGWRALRLTTLSGILSVFPIMIKLGSLREGFVSAVVSIAGLGAAMLPLLLGIGITGALFVPAMFAWMSHTLQQERKILTRAG